MKKHVYGRQFKRDSNERKALFKGLINSLVLLERIQTTEQKAKAIRGQAEKLVTKAKVRKEESRPFLQPYLSSKAIAKVIGELSVRYVDRPGGYTRIIKAGRRMSDGASMAYIEWVDRPVSVEIIVPKSKLQRQEVIEEVKTESEMQVEEIKAPIKKTLRPAQGENDKKETKKAAKPVADKKTAKKEEKA